MWDQTDSAFLREVEVVLEEICAAPERLDQDPQSLRQAFIQLGRRSLLGLKGPQEWGGRQIPPLLFYQFQEQVARHSGSLAFLQTQHQSAVSKLAQCDNLSLQQRYLRPAIEGTVGIGVGFSHIRRSGSPLVQAIPSKDGYRIHGHVPWITGYGCFDIFILGATLPDQRVIFGLVPLSDTVQQTGGCITLSNPLELAAMMSSQTVQATLQDWLMRPEDILAVKAADWIHQSDRRNTLNHSFFALGCARAGLDIINNAAHSPHASAAIAPTWERLNAALSQCRHAIYTVQQQNLENHHSQHGTKAERHRLDLRAQAIHLAVQCAHGAVIVSRGAANILSHPAQRIYREALAFSVFGQTTAVMEATLAAMLDTHTTTTPQHPHD